MKYRSKIVADSIGPNGVRLTTMEFDIWKPLLAEFNTHGLLGSRNFPSSRARPWSKVRETILADPHIPQFRKNSPGMQPAQPLRSADQDLAAGHWLNARDEMLKMVETLGDKDGLNIHKQWLNRLIEPWTTVTGIVTATDWENFWNLRTELNDDGLPMAQDEFYFMTLAMKKAMSDSEPKELKPGEWHLPYVPDVYECLSSLGWGLESDYRYSNDISVAMSSAGKCATVSYDNLGEGVNHSKDYDRAVDKLLPFGHMSVFQHQACCLPEMVGQMESKWLDTGMMPITGASVIGVSSTAQCWWGQLRGWGQFRKILPNEGCWKSPNTHRELALTLPDLHIE